MERDAEMERWRLKCCHVLEYYAACGQASILIYSLNVLSSFQTFFFPFSFILLLSPSSSTFPPSLFTFSFHLPLPSSPSIFPFHRLRSPFPFTVFVHRLRSIVPRPEIDTPGHSRYTMTYTMTMTYPMTYTKTYTMTMTMTMTYTMTYTHPRSLKGHRYVGRAGRDRVLCECRRGRLHELLCRAAVRAAQPVLRTDVPGAL